MSRGAPLACEPLPPRPYLPPTFAGALVGFMASLLFMQVGWQSFVANDASAVAASMRMMAAGGCIGSSALAAGTHLLLRRRSGARARWLREAGAWACCALAAVAISTAIIVGRRAEQLDRLAGATVSTFVFEPHGDGRLSDFGYQVTASVLADDGDRLATVSLSAEHEVPDGRLRLVGRLSPWADDPWSRRRFFAGEVAEVSLMRVIDAREGSRDPVGVMRASVLQAIDPASSQARALIAGIVCGRTTELNRCDAQEWFSITGTSHLVAVSGSHLALVSSLAGLMLARMRVSLGARLVLLCALSAVYVVFTGGAASAVRSLAMVAAASLPRVFGRRAHAPSGLSLSVMIMLALDPGLAYDLGFQLSVASVLSIGLFYRYLAWHLVSWGVPAAVAEPLALTLSAQGATLPITIPVFGEVSLIAPVANLVLGPVMSALLVCGLVLAPFAALIPAPDVVLAPVDLLAALSLFLAQLLSAVPMARMVIDAQGAGALLACALVTLLVAMYGCWARVSRRCAALIVTAFALVGGVHVIRWRYFAPPSVTVLDVGQGDAILIRDGSSAVLVDCGVDDAVGAALARNNVMHLDAVIITHWDRDHWGGLPTVLATAEVERIVVAEGAADAVPAEARALDLPPLLEMGSGDAFAVRGFGCQAVWPRKAVQGDENADSLVLAVRYSMGSHTLSMLLTGDTEADQAEDYAAQVGNIDVLKMGHHGSAASVSDEMLEVLDPAVAVASAGEGNAYGHPDPGAVACVERRGVRFVCTIDEGDVVFVPM